MPLHGCILAKFVRLLGEICEESVLQHAGSECSGLESGVCQRTRQSTGHSWLMLEVVSNASLLKSNVGKPRILCKLVSIGKSSGVAVDRLCSPSKVSTTNGHDATMDKYVYLGSIVT